MNQIYQCINNSLHLAQKCAGIVARGHYLHQTPSRRVALLFAARACDSEVSLLAGYLFRKAKILSFEEQKMSKDKYASIFL